MSPGAEPFDPVATDPVAAFLSAQMAHDWDRVAALLAPGIVRTGPDGERSEGRDTYLEYLRAVHASMTGYKFEILRLVYSADRRVALVEIHEQLVQADGEPLAVTEAMVFDIDRDGRIALLSVYTKVGPDE